MRAHSLSMAGAGRRNVRGQVQMMASTRCRSQFGKQRVPSRLCGLGGSESTRGLAWCRSPRKSPDQALVRDHSRARRGRFAGLCSMICSACSRSSASLGLPMPKPVTVASQVTMSIRLDPQYHRECEGQYPFPRPT
jgi:hypothetical protein